MSTESVVASRDSTTDDELDQDYYPGTSNGRGWRLPVIFGLIALAAIAFAVWQSRSHNAATPSAAVTTTTAKVTKSDLTETTSFDGVLTFSDSRTIKSKANGTVTWLPASGATIKQGGILYKVNAAPAVLMYGTVPMYRALQAGVADGADVQQLEKALHALGYDPNSMTVDQTFTAATTAAIKAWQGALGLTEDGIASPGLVQFLGKPIRVQALSAQVGDTTGSDSALYSASSTSRIATVSLSATDSTVAHVGEAVTVTLPSGKSVPGRITDTSTVASSSSSSSGSGGGGGSGGSVNQQGGSSSTTSTQVAVTVSVTAPEALNATDQTPVTIAFASAGAKNVLAVPVTALVALTGGGYAIEVVDAGGATHLVAVTPGLYAVGGLVEVSGAGVTEGLTVVVPATA